VVAKRRDAEGKISVGPTWESIVERQIREAMEEGRFDELPYHGEPLPVDDDSAAGHDLFPNAIGVLYRAKAVDALEIATGNRDVSVTPPRGNEQRVERHVTAILELHDAR